MSRLRDVRLAYRAVTFGVMQVFGFVFAGVGIAFAFAAAVDLAFDFGWGWTWVVIPGGVALTLAGLGFAWLVHQFTQAVDHFFPL